MKTYMEQKHRRPSDISFEEEQRRDGKIMMIFLGVLMILGGLFFFISSFLFGLFLTLLGGCIISWACWYYQKPQQKPKK